MHKYLFFNFAFRVPRVNVPLVRASTIFHSSGLAVFVANTLCVSLPKGPYFILGHGVLLYRCPIKKW